MQAKIIFWLRIANFTQDNTSAPNALIGAISNPFIFHKKVSGPETQQLMYLWHSCSGDTLLPS